MAESYSEGRTRDGEYQEQFLNDKTLRRLGATIAGLFTLGVGGLVAVIIFTQVDFDLFREIIYPQFVEAFLRVLGIVLVGSLLSVTAGVIVGLGRVSNTRFTNAVATGYVEFFRGTPLLFQLLVIFTGIPAFWPPGQFPISEWAIPTAIIGLTLNHAAYVGEAVRGGIDAVPDGQMEAARSLGMSYVQGMREVVLPQAWRNALAAIGNDQVILVKDTSLLTVIAVPELISAFRNVNSATFDPWTPIILVAIAYLMITIPLGKVVSHLETRSDWGGDRR
ncbi:ABC-type glutamine/glutamate/polar amino acids transport system, permease protein [Haloferax mucosum ATCC BAA-1512]|uniref:ABC-type glutamine/glutamate/polar amino acids transport system, permease protein n=1 Tax=Haloferax mucosum ATCC BAA-1512 TaxID=662479 RepID=M0IIZ8_9EURY|nr:amino acid ABC transporter permease [Haloferax mucosum]ELZ96776.1 ABC-type glutamine/glutamate/polar amino acids transport system, permease protein [Haloferax mucosum ATCC BAA-1512]